MKKNRWLLLALFALLFSTLSCNKNYYCGCESKGELFENLTATITNLGQYTLQFDQPIKGHKLYVVCEGIPDSLKIDSLKVKYPVVLKIFVVVRMETELARQ